MESCSDPCLWRCPSCGHTTLVRQETARPSAVQKVYRCELCRTMTDEAKLRMMVERRDILTI